MASVRIRDLHFSYPLNHRWLHPVQGIPKTHVQVFSGLSLNIDDGMRLGVIGRNGAGKTTLLRLIAGILEPTAGEIRVDGEVSSLLGLKFGGDSELTGAEHIYLRGAYMGKRREEIAARCQEIIEFADLGEFIDLPVDIYSAGMFSRLAFSIVTSFSPQVLLLDEMIGAGDKSFARKAADRLKRMIDAANILVLATHDERLMQRVCNYVLDLDTGEVRKL